MNIYELSDRRWDQVSSLKLRILNDSFIFGTDARFSDYFLVTDLLFHVIGSVPEEVWVNAVKTVTARQDSALMRKVREQMESEWRVPPWLYFQDKKAQTAIAIMAEESTKGVAE